MKLKSVYIRFYKSFNYHYLRKLDRTNPNKNITTMPWEFIGEKYYPHVEIPIDKQITTVVGANESGKSHLLSAIEKGIFGENGEFSIDREDFCRYSHFFQSVDGDVPHYPDFGFQWVDLTEPEQEKVQKLCKLTKEKRKISRFYFFRTRDEATIYLPAIDSNELERFSVKESLEDLLPPVLRINSKIALPDRVSIQELLKGRKTENDKWEPFDRRRAFQFASASDDITNLLQVISQAPSQDNINITLNKDFQEQAKQISSVIESNKFEMKRKEQLEAIKAFNLAYDLIFKIAGITAEDIEMLQNSLRDGRTGIVKSVVNKINRALEIKLRFPRIWSQDKNFALRIDPTEHELNFIINDRTECQYSFDERSSGLRHFLSYYIQYLTHESAANATSEILLMDEPDAFLSGEAQQDLLKIFQMFADPIIAGKGKKTVPVQVIYVTHSPFLIDKNHAERVRALEKPEGTKGTRVIPGAAQNRYEPIRSAFGAFVGEITFISQCNLMVEGPADQILLAGTASYLRKLQDVPESELLDLNQITIVPCGGTDNVPYMVYLARGRDPEKPAVIVLLDSDSSGNKAKLDLSKTGPHPGNKAALTDKFILQLGDISREETGWSLTDKNIEEKPFKVLEDLIPLSLSVRAVRNFLHTLFDLTDEQMTNLTDDKVPKEIKGGESAFSAIKRIVSQIEPANSFDIDKVPFARTIVDLLPVLAEERTEKNNGEVSGIDELEANLRAVFRRLRLMQTLAEEDVKDKKMRRKVKEKVDTFLSDFQDVGTAKRDDVSRLLKDIESDLEGDDNERGFIVQEIASLRQRHRLDEDPTEFVGNFDDIVDSLERLKNAKDLAVRSPEKIVQPRIHEKSDNKTELSEETKSKPVVKNAPEVDTESETLKTT